MLPAELVGPVETGLNQSTRWTGGLLNEDPATTLSWLSGVPTCLLLWIATADGSPPAGLLLSPPATDALRPRRGCRTGEEPEGDTSLVINDPLVHLSGHLLNSPWLAWSAWVSGGSPEAELLVVVPLAASVHQAWDHQVEFAISAWPRLCELPSRCREQWLVSDADCDPASRNMSTDRISRQHPTSPEAPT